MALGRRILGKPADPAEARAFLEKLDFSLTSKLHADDWQGKAGGYAIQGPAGAFIPWMSGSYSAIMGLPLAETATLLRAAGLPVGGVQ